MKVVARLLVALLAAVAPAAAQDYYLAADRPTCTNNSPQQIFILDATSATDCTTTGGSTFEAHCICRDGTWSAYSSGGGTDVALDLDNNGSDESAALVRITTTDDDYDAATETTADELDLNIGRISPYRNYDPDRPPSTLGTGGFSEEWYADTASVSWEWMNQGATTETIELDGATLAAPTNAGNSIRARCEPAPAADFVLHARGSGNQRSDFNAFGISLLQGTLGAPTRIDTMEIQNPSNNFQEFTASRWTSATGFGANHGNTSDFDETAGVTKDVCLLISFVDAGNTATFSFSWDCRTYFAAASSINIAANPDYACYHVRSDDTTDAMTAHFQWVRLRTDSGRATPSD